MARSRWSQGSCSGLALLVALCLAAGPAFARNAGSKAPAGASKKSVSAAKASREIATDKPDKGNAAKKVALRADRPAKPATKSPPSARVKGTPTRATQPENATTEAVKSPSPKPIPESMRAWGPLSVGHPHAGFLVNGERLPASDDWVITVPSHGYGTHETNQALALCIGQVRRDFADSPKVMLGSLSAERGGHLPPHKSHRTGRDVDVYFFRKPGARWVKAATEQDIDLPRTWALLRCFITRTDVDMVLIDKRVQAWLESYAVSIGEDRQWLNDVFHDKGKAKTAVVRHVPGHVAHMHVRFASPRARRAAVQHYDELVAAGVIVPEKRALVHEVQKGDTLLGLARRYGMTVADIQRLNGMSSTVIRVGQKLTIQQAVDIRGARDPVGVRPRVLPPGERLARIEVSEPPPTIQPTLAEPAPEASPAALDSTSVGSERPPGPPPRLAPTESPSARPRSPAPSAALGTKRAPS